MKISIVIPVYNNENTLNILHSSIKKIFNKKKEKYEIIFVNDGSIDNSLKKIKKICLQDSNVFCIDLTKNFGQRFATIAGVRFSTGDYVLNLDADLQDPVYLVELFIKKILTSKKDIILAVRRSVKEAFFRKLTSYF